MKRFFSILFLVVFGFSGRSQNSMIAFFKDSLSKTTVDSNKAYCLYSLSYYYQNSKPDSALLLAKSAYSLSLKSDFLRGKIGSLGQIALAFNRMGNFPKALEYYLEQLKIIEKQKDQENIASVFLSIAFVYNSQKDAAKSLYYAYKADSVARVNKLPVMGLYTSLGIGEIYSNYDQLDSALLYTERCYTESIKQKNDLVPGLALYNMINIYFTSGDVRKAFNSFKDKDKYRETASQTFDLLTGTALNNMGNIYYKSGKYMPALSNFKNSLLYVEPKQDYNTLAECNLGIAKTFDKLNIPDSAFFYANRSFQLASNNQFLKHAISASAFLTQLYKQRKLIDSAFAYKEMHTALKDSFDNSEKIKQLQSLTIEEQLRQQQLLEQRSAERKERRLKLELLMIGMFIPVLFFISVYLGRKKVHRRVIQFSIIFSLLFLFEYIIFLLHPLVAKGTDHTPVLEILIFVAIAAIISPTHHRIEHWLMTRLTERHNNKMQAAVKTAEKTNRSGDE